MKKKQSQIMGPCFQDLVSFLRTKKRIINYHNHRFQKLENKSLVHMIIILLLTIVLVITPYSGGMLLIFGEHDASWIIGKIWLVAFSMRFIYVLMVTKSILFAAYYSIPGVAGISCIRNIWKALKTDWNKKRNKKSEQI